MLTSPMHMLEAHLEDILNGNCPPSVVVKGRSTLVPYANIDAIRGQLFRTERQLWDICGCGGRAEFPEGGDPCDGDEESASQWMDAHLKWRTRIAIDQASWRMFIDHHNDLGTTDVLAGTPIEALLLNALCKVFLAASVSAGEGSVGHLWNSWCDRNALRVFGRDTEDCVHFDDLQRSEERWRRSLWGKRVGQMYLLFEQPRIGPYRPDFILIRERRSSDSAPTRERPLAIECDGRDYHDAHDSQRERDRIRDRQILAMGIPTIRFSGSEIWDNPVQCALSCYATLKSMGSAT